MEKRKSVVKATVGICLLCIFVPLGPWWGLLGFMGL